MIWACATAQASIPSAQQPEAADRAFIGVRILKAEGAGTILWTPQKPTTCAECRFVLNQVASGENAKEVFFHMWVPRSGSTVGPMFVKIDPRLVRGVLVGNTDTELSKRGFVRAESRARGMEAVGFKRVPGGISFDIPLQPNGASLPSDDLADVTQFYTFIETPGMYIRVSHADQARRRGAYATGPWPELEAKAALNLEFAAKEAIKELRLDRTLPSKGVTRIVLMNFDTNYPTLGPDEAHEDWPPHWHMHLFWNDRPRVRKVGHFYIGPDGLLLQNQSGDFKVGTPGVRVKHWYRRGEADETRTPTGELLYSHTITPKGHFELASPAGSCRFTPVSGGFDSGVDLACSTGRSIRRIRADDDLSTGRLRFFIGDDVIEEHRYDRDSGALLTEKASAGLKRMATQSSSNLIAREPAPTYFRLNK